METIIPRRWWLTLAAFLLVLPAAWFMGANFLEHELGIRGPLELIEPWFDSINLLILLGPPAALALSALQVIGFEWGFTKEQLQFRILLEKRWGPIFIAFLSGTVLFMMALYLFGENCNCH
jgi:hypothetical protein